MSKIHVLDVTLRDGGLCRKFQFTHSQIDFLLTQLNQTQVDMVEVGYKRLQAQMDLGLPGSCPSKYLKRCKSILTQTQMAVMIHHDPFELENFLKLKEVGVDLVRICIPKDKQHPAFELAQKAKQAGLKVSLNIKNISLYSLTAFAQLAEQAVQAGADLLYLADSNGSLHPYQVKAFFEVLESCPIPLGFHAHDNLGLAQANAVAALEGGATYIDASLGGFGKGAGNVKLEFWLAYLMSRGQNWALPPCVEASNFVRAHFLNPQKLETIDLIRGIENLSAAQTEQRKQALKL